MIAARKLLRRALQSAPLAALLLAATPLAQGPLGGGAHGPGGWPTQPGTPFTWAENPASLGPVRAQTGNVGSWTVFSNEFQFRWVPSYSGDPTFEVILFPPISGHPTKLERFLVQFPMGVPPGGPEQKGLILGFHPFGVSEKSVFQGTTLPYICALRKWILVAPYGQTDTNFGCVDSQVALDAVLRFVDLFLDWNQDRIYTVGFSMGGLNAVSYAMRHLQDPDNGMRVAGVICHTGTMDVVAEYWSGTQQLQNLLQDDFHFYGPPNTHLFNYERITPYRLKAGAVNPNKASVRNLAHIPFYLHVNLDDPNTDLVAQNLVLRDFLVSEGVTVNAHSVNAGNQHSWSTLPMADAILWIEQFTLANNEPQSGVLFMDRPTRYLGTELLSPESPSEVAFLEYSTDTSMNQVDVTDTRVVERLALDLPEMRVDTSITFGVAHSSADDTPVELVLRGLTQAPSSVLANGTPTLNYSYDGRLGELTITPSPLGAYTLLQFLP